jgi:hypothetical protein
MWGPNEVGSCIRIYLHLPRANPFSYPIVKALELINSGPARLMELSVTKVLGYVVKCLASNKLRPGLRISQSTTLSHAERHLGGQKPILS